MYFLRGDSGSDPSSSRKYFSTERTSGVTAGGRSSFIQRKKQGAHHGLLYFLEYALQPMGAAPRRPQAFSQLCPSARWARCPYADSGLFIVGILACTAAGRAFFCRAINMAWPRVLSQGVINFCRMARAKDGWRLEAIPSFHMRQLAVVITCTRFLD